ncbi:MAG: nitroreductase family protein [Chlorobi bacterium]|nr:nitroreductase family protein [Chlorobiota bacterium]
MGEAGIFYSVKEFTEEERIKLSKEIYKTMNERRTARNFSNRYFSEEVLMNCIRAAGTAPSGANRQPWKFIVIKDKNVKKKIREEAEKEERKFYDNRAPEEWKKALEPFGTNAEKSFLETAPYLIAIFEEKYSYDEDGNKIKNYYTKESVGIAAGMLINALHQCGIAALTHTPSPMNFLNKILNRPENEKPFLLLVAGFPAENATVPDIARKKLDEIFKMI